MTAVKTLAVHAPDVKEKKRSKVADILDTYIELADERERLLRDEGLDFEARNYKVLKYILHDVKEHIKQGGVVSTKKTYVLPGAIWIAKSLAEGRITIDEAADAIGATRYLSVKLFRTLTHEKNLTLVIPSNLSPKDVNVYLWTDKVGYDREGNPLYMLTMYFSFPFDISEIDRRSEYEPVSVLFVRKGGKFIPLKAYARVHYDVYVYDLENLENMEVMFLRHGHTPKIVGKEVARASSSNVLKELLDKAWLVIGDFITQVTGVNRVRIKDEKDKVHVFITHKLPKTKNNVFETAIHPYFIDITWKV